VSALLILVAAIDSSASNQPIWTWDRETQSCVLREQFSSDGDEFEIIRTPGNGETSISLIERAKHGDANCEYREGRIDPSGTTDANITVRVGVLHRRGDWFAVQTRELSAVNSAKPVPDQSQQRQILLLNPHRRDRRAFEAARLDARAGQDRADLAQH
jgi:hypothetical protein